jgi:hypothetical protein
MAQPATSLNVFKLGPDNPKICALGSCDKVVTDVRCTTCASAPKSDFSGTLEDVQYCTKDHCDQDVENHKETCRDRRWLRDGMRVGEALHDISLVVLEATYYRVVVKYEEGSNSRVYTMRDCDKPASEQSFCGPDVDLKIKFCALNINQCVFVLQLGSPFLAYMTKGLSAASSTSR